MSGIPRTVGHRSAGSWFSSSRATGARCCGDWQQLCVALLSLAAAVQRQLETAFCSRLLGVRGASHLMLRDVDDVLNLIREGRF